MITFQVKITDNGRIITDSTEALHMLQAIWLGRIIETDIHEVWADGTWIIDLPFPRLGEDTIETLDYTFRDGLHIHAERD